MFDFLDIDPAVDQLLEDVRCDGVTLFGAGNFARAVYSALQSLGVQVRAFVVSGPSTDIIDNIPVLSLDKMDSVLCALPMWLAVFNRNAASDLVTLAKICKKQGIKKILLPQEYFEVIASQMGWRYWLADRRQYAAKRMQIEAAFRMLDDEESQRQFIEAVRFRLGMSLDKASQPSSDIQYLPHHLISGAVLSRQGITFVDGGAYDGDTIMQVAEKLDLATAYAFEPDLDNFKKLVQNAKKLDFPVISFPCGLSNNTEWFSFSSGNSQASAIIADGNSKIQCVTLDECLVGERVDYIKLDVEGHEIAALEGSRRIIDLYRPALAIAAYHRWDDIWRIPEFLQCYASDYRIIYRTHQYNTFESAFYATC